MRFVCSLFTLVVTACTASGIALPTPTISFPSPTAVAHHTTDLTATPAVYQQEETRCLQIQEGSAPDLQGTLILEPNDSQNAVLFDLADSSSVKIGRANQYLVSPDGKRLAYQDLDQDSLVITDSTGHQQEKFTNIWTDLYLVRWINNSQIALDFTRRAESEEQDDQISLVVLNVDTGVREEIQQENFPKLDGDLDSVLWDSYSHIILDPSLKLAVYPSQEEQGPQHGVPAVLWSITDSIPLAQVYFGDYSDSPRWSPSGESFVISAPIQNASEGITYTNVDDGLPVNPRSWDLLLVSDRGEISRLTYFSIHESVVLERQEWSPLGNFISFSRQDKETYDIDSPGELAVVNTQTKIVTNFCVGSYFVVWSLDEKFIAITLFSDDIPNTYALDVNTGQAWLISEDTYVAGWMNTSP